MNRTASRSNQQSTRHTQAFGSALARGGLSLLGGLVSHLAASAMIDGNILSGPNNLPYLTIAGVLLAYLLSGAPAHRFGQLWARAMAKVVQVPPDAVLAAFAGATLGLLLTVLLNNVLAEVPGFTWYWSQLIAVVLVLGAGGFFVANRRLIPFLHPADPTVMSNGASAPRDKVIDTSAIIDGRPLDDLPVGDLATYNLITLPPNALMGDALAKMLRHRIHRIVVAEGDTVHGVVESLDVFSFLSNHSHLILTRIDQADSLEALEGAAGQTTRMVQQLYRSGTNVGLIGDLVQEVNARLFERTWEMIAPPELVKNSCLIVMGSEGRGEQLLKTDQDNGLILRDDYTPPANLQDICDRFSAELERFGYPECAGKIMLNNPDWRGTVSEWSERTRTWMIQGSPENLMNLAIFLDAHAVTGDERLLDRVRDRLWELATDNEATLSRFASAIDAFGSGSNWLSRVFALGDSGELLHMKKLGIFPIVHGIRSLALANRIKATGTVERIHALVQMGKLKQSWGDNLINSLHIFMGMRLKVGLQELEAGKPVSGHVDVSEISSLERDLLKDSLGIVKRFKATLHQRFRLDVM